MKKLAFALVLVLLATPVWATVAITCTPGPGDCNVTISYISTEATPIRGFGLDIDTGDANVVRVQCVDPNYYVYPGSIAIDASGTVTGWGQCICEGYAGTQSGLGEPNVTIEMISNYIGEANKPSNNGTLAIITLECTDLVTVYENTILGGVVMEDPNEDPTVINGGGATPTGCGSCPDELPANCWRPTECAGQSLGDSTCDGKINFADLFALKTAFGKNAPWTDPQCCSDYNHSGGVNFGDLFVLKTNFGTGGHTPSTGRQSCGSLNP